MIFRTMPGHLIRRLQQMAAQAFSRRVQAAGLDITSVQFAALEAIRIYPGSDQGTVAALIDYDRATVGGVIDRLVAKALVHRDVSKEDRRARVLHLTQAGEAVFRTLIDAATLAQQDMMAPLTSYERTTFLALANKLLQNPPDQTPAG